MKRNFAFCRRVQTLSWHEVRGAVRLIFSPFRPSRSRARDVEGRRAGFAALAFPEATQ